MDRTYFERWHQQEARDTEWQMLNAVLAPPREPRQWEHRLRWLRRTVGGWLIRIGAQVAGTTPPLAPCTCPEDGTQHQTCVC
jgi:hypothetical protein